MDTGFWGVNLGMGLCVAGVVFAARTSYAEFLAFVERDLADRLRSLRIVTKQLRLWINVWLALAVALMFGLTLGLDMPVFALLAGLGMAATPWYIVMRLASARRQKLEDQLADAMVMFFQRRARGSRCRKRWNC